jgi:hypothetical protein
MDAGVEGILAMPRAGLGVPVLRPGSGVQVLDPATFVVPTITDRDPEASKAHIQKLSRELLEWSRDRKKPYGNHTPIVAQAAGPDLKPPYTVVFGRHRFLAAQAAGLKIRAEIVTGLTEEQAVRDELSENVYRLNLDSYFLVRRAMNLVERFPNRSHKELADWLNISDRQFRYYLAVGKKPELLEKVRLGHLTIKEANAQIRVSREVEEDADEFLHPAGGASRKAGDDEKEKPPALRFVVPTAEKPRMAFVLDLPRASKKERLKGLEILEKLRAFLNEELNPNDSRRKDRREKRHPDGRKRRSADKD